MANKCLRCIAITYVDYKEAEWNQLVKEGILESQDGIDSLEKNLRMIMLVGIADPLKKNVPEAVRVLREAGVNTRMVTGDNLKTAVAIAKQAGILDHDWDKVGEDDNENDRDREARLKYTCMEGPEFKRLTGGTIKIKLNNDPNDDRTRDVIKNTKRFREIAKYLKVMANSAPENKICLVTGLRGSSPDDPNSNVVAVTGDGTNDAPALKKADVGFAMKSGTDTALKAGSVVLLTDDFSKTVACVKYGRNIFDCVRKFLQF